MGNFENVNTMGEGGEKDIIYQNAFQERQSTREIEDGFLTWYKNAKGSKDLFDEINYLLNNSVDEIIEKESKKIPKPTLWDMQELLDKKLMYLAKKYKDVKKDKAEIDLAKKEKLPKYF